jgi:pimeloyl-ACP methyl ester carboxylesterase
MKEFEVYKSEKAAHRVHKLYRDYLNSWPIAHEEKFISTRFGNTFMIKSGPEAAPAVVMLHGTMATVAMWREEILTLSKDYHVFAVDVIGDAGFSAPVRPPTNTDGHALWLHDVLEALGQLNAHFVGLSFGGWLVLDFAVRFPEQVNSLTLITPGGVADKNIIVWALPLLLLGSWGAEKVRERIVGRSQTIETEQQARLSEFSAAIFEGMKPRTESLRKISDDELASLDIPVLVLLGADDVTMDSMEIERRFKRLVSQAEVKIFPGKRHFLGNQSEAIHGFLSVASRILD